ncbi:MAG: S-layer homology domain-containing protein [Actinobacteria bacterium]|nr:S-layer homology domain-containing protein [Actinomycetota bacterium]
MSRTARSAVRSILRPTALATTALVLAGLLIPTAAAAAPAGAAASAGPAAPVDLVDGDATPATRSLFSSLQDLRGKGILFGHQHDTDYGTTFSAPDGASSDVKAATDDYPAVFGFDTLIIEGKEKPGVAGASGEQNALTLANSIRQAHDLGGIATLSAHMPNFATGGDFYDTSGDTLRAVLPGGAKNADLNAFLDLIAVAATHATDANGVAIPIIFRPWHENAGSWFWWGAAFGTPGEYAELYRYTVEYLRDLKGVHNLLYAFSPGGGFGGNADQYLRTYPGDDFVDVLGYDTYDAAADSTFLGGLVSDLGMISDLADARGKISAFTEFGITGGVMPDGQNKNVHWYMDVLNAIKADPRASRSAYMLTWANFGGTTTPYTPTSGEMLPDFQAYHADPYTLFAQDLPSDLLTRTVDSVPTQPTAHLASPAAGSRVAGTTQELRASVQHVPGVDKVTVSVDGTSQVVELTAPATGSLWWTGTWSVPDALRTNATHGLTLHAYAGGAEVMTTTSSIVVGQAPVMAPGEVDDFEGYGDDAALRGAYVQYNSNTISLEHSSADAPVGDGSRALKLDYSFATQSYTGFGKQLSADWSGFWDFQAWVHPDGSNNKLVLQLVAGGVTFEAYPSLAGTTASLVDIPFADWRPAPWDTAHAAARLTPDVLAKVTQFNVYVNAVDGGASSGSLALDALRAVVGTPPPTTYRDVPRDDADYAAIQWLHDEVADLGDKNGSFHPTRAVKGDEAVKVFAAYDTKAHLTGLVAPAAARRLALAEALWQRAGSPAVADGATFKDVPGASAKAAAWAVSAGIVTPLSKTQFGVNGSVSRAELARWLSRTDVIVRASRPIPVVDFATGAQGWAVPDWQTNGGTATAANGHLVVNAASGGDWVSGPGGQDFSSRTQLIVDIPATTGVGMKAALQLGADWTWCETAAAPWAGAGAHTGADAIVLDLTTLTPDCQALLGQVRGINLFVNEGRTEIGSLGVR